MFDNLVPVELRNVSIASFYPTERLIQKLIIGIEAVQSGSGDPSPDNVRPISGFTGCNVYRTGVNVWDEEWEVGGISGSTGEDANNGVQIRSKNYIPVKTDVQYYFANKGITSGNNTQGRFYDKDKNYIGSTTAGGTAVMYNAAFTPPANAAYMRFAMQTAYGTTYNNDISINYPSSDHDYHAYVGTTLPVSWQSEAGTVYGGTLDVITGLLTVTHGIVDLGDYDWTYYTGGTNPIFYTTVTGTRQYSNGDMPNAISSMYKVRISQSRSNFARYALDGEFTFLSTTESLAIRNSDYTSAAAFKTAMSGQTVVYELATPLAYQLTPQQIATIRLGINNVWCDTGPVIELIS